MLTLAIILCYLLGLSVMLLISRKYSLTEVIGYSFLIGMGLETFILFLLDVIHVQYSQGIIIGINLVAIAAINGGNYRNLLAIKNDFKLPTFDIKKIDLAAVFILCGMAFLFEDITIKNLFWPTAEHDSIGSFDKLGRIMAIEGKLKISLFQYHLQGAGGIYPPLFHGSLAYAYIFGAVMGKIITTLFFLSLLTTFYSLLRNYLSAWASALFTLLLMITPELFSHAALSLDNLPTTAYVGPGALATFVWLDKRDTKYLWLGAILTAFGIWVRSDTIVFTAASLVIIGIDFLRKRDLKDDLAYAALIVAPFLIWTLYLKFKIAQTQTARFNLAIGYNAERMHAVTAYVKAYLFGGEYGRIDGGQLYGIVFLFFFLAIFINLVLIYKAGVKKILIDKMYVLIFFFTALFLYTAVFYFISEKAQGEKITGLMESSFKRGLFCFIPVALFYTATSYGPKWVLDRVEKFRTAG
jgi:hypothetical protein